MSLLAVLLAGESAIAAPRVLVCLPKAGASLTPEVERAFAWASPVVLAPDTVARRFPRSPESQAAADGERRLVELLRAAEADFLALRFDAAIARLDEGARILDAQPPSVRGEAAFVRLQLLRGRVAEARGGAGAAEAFAHAAEAAIEVELGEAEYPPRVRQLYQAARAAVRARPRRSVEVTSEPPDAEIEVAGQLVGRTPARVELPPGRCFLSVTRAGFKPHLAACPTEPKLAVALQPATKDGLRDQLRDRIASDAAWFLEPVLLDMLATVEDARWIVVLERDRGRGLKALVFSAAEHALKPIEPARFIDGELDKLSAAVRGLVLRGQRLDASAIDTPSGTPALEARAGDPGLGSAVAFVRRAGSRDYLRFGLVAAGGGRFIGGLPPLLADDGGWDVEYYVEGRDASGGVACTAGNAATPLRFRRPAGVVAGATSARPSRWYLWLAVVVAAAGAAATGVYLGTRSDDVSVRFGARP